MSVATVAGTAGGSLLLVVAACGIGSSGPATASPPPPSSEAGSAPVAARLADSATAVLRNAAGAEAGRVVLRETPAQGVLLAIRVTGLPEGAHGVHIHETGSCEPPTFQSAGGHYDPHGRAHGPLHPDGMHGGDMLNLHVPATGEARTERLAPHVTLRPGAAHTLFDDDGSAIVVHADPDDYRSQPSGDAGDRVFCGVIRR